MASQVPYTGAPSIAPQIPPTPTMNVAAPAGAFGAETAQALQHLGQVSAQAGNELFGRAIAIQQMHEQAKASEAASEYSNQVAAEFSKYQTLQGKDAVDGYQPFVDRVNSIRADLRQNLTSPLAQQIYDQDTRRTQNYTVFSSASHSAQQGKSYVLGAAKARIDASENMALANPADDGLFEDNVAKAQSDARFMASQAGMSPEATDEQVRNVTSSLWRARIQGMAKGQPFAAQKLLNKAVKDGSLAGADIMAVSDFVQKQQNNVGSREITRWAYNGADGKWGSVIVPLEAARNAIASNEGTYTSRGPQVTDKAGNTGRGLGRYQVMSYNLAPWLKEAGMPSMSEEQFLSDRSAQDKLFDFKFGQYQQKYGSWNRAASAWFTGNPDADGNASDGYHTKSWYIAHGNAALARSASRSDMDEVVRSRSRELAPDNPDLPDYSSQHAQIYRSRQDQIKREGEQQAKEVISTALMPDNDGKLPTSVDEIKSNPQVAAVWDALPSDKQLAYMKVLQSNAGRGYAPTDENQAQFHQLQGIGLNPASSPEDLDKFLETDMMTLHMPMNQRVQLFRLQQQVFKKSQSNPALNSALGFLVKTNPAIADIYKDKDEAPRFVSGLYQGMQQFMEANKRPPKNDEINEIAGQLLREVGGQTTMLHWFGGGTAPFYESSVPNQIREQWINMAKTQGKPAPSEEDMMKMYMALQFKQFYASKKAAK